MPQSSSGLEAGSVSLPGILYTQSLVEEAKRRSQGGILHVSYQIYVKTEQTGVRGNPYVLAKGTVREAPAEEVKNSKESMREAAASSISRPTLGHQLC